MSLFPPHELERTDLYEFLEVMVLLDDKDYLGVKFKCLSLFMARSLYSKFVGSSDCSNFCAVSGFSISRSADALLIEFVIKNPATNDLTLCSKVVSEVSLYEFYFSLKVAQSPKWQILRKYE